MANSFMQLNLHDNITKALQICGYQQPTPVQAQAIPIILQQKDLVACAQTGTGKTAAFVLPALHRLAEEKKVSSQHKKASVLILTPTRELASQITKAISTYSRCMQRVTIANLVGGMPYHHQIRDLERGADLIVATPGRLLDHMENKRVDLSKIKMLVLDEADRMLDMGFIDDVQYIANLTPNSRQTLLFSATMDKQLNAVVRRLLKNPMNINLSQEKIAAPHIEQHFYKVNHLPHKIRLLNHLLVHDNFYKVIIFSATKINADKLARQLNEAGFAAAALHGDLRQNVRNRTIEQFRRGKVHILVATDVAARGLDISDITHVVNFDLPKFCEDYVHRIGRTGRAGRAGIAISFILPADIKHLQRIERYLNQRFKIVHNTDFINADAAAGRKSGGENDALGRRSGAENSIKNKRQIEHRHSLVTKNTDKARLHYEKRKSAKSFTEARDTNVGLHGKINEKRDHAFDNRRKKTRDDKVNQFGIEENNFAAKKPKTKRYTAQNDNQSRNHFSRDKKRGFKKSNAANEDRSFSPVRKRFVEKSNTLRSK